MRLEPFRTPATATLILAIGIGMAAAMYTSSPNSWSSSLRVADG